MDQKKGNILEKIHWKEILVRAGVLFILFFVYSSVIQPDEEEYSIRIMLRQDRTGSNTQLFWWDTGQEADPTQSYMAGIYGRQVRLPLIKEMMGTDKQWRLDIVDNSLEVGILSFDLYKGERLCQAFSPDILDAYEVECTGIEAAYTTGEEYCVKPSGDDPAIYFGSSIAQDITDYVEQDYETRRQQLFLMLLLVVVADRLPGVRRISRYCWKRRRGIGFVLVITMAWGILTLPRMQDYSLQIKLAEENEGNQAQLYWWTQDGTPSPEQSILAEYYSRQSILDLGKGALGWQKSWRLDVTNSSEEITLVSIDLYKKSNKIRTFSGNELEGYLTGGEGIKAVYAEGGGLVISPSADDPILYLGNSMSNGIMNQLTQYYLSRLFFVLLGGILLVLLGTILGILQRVVSLGKFIWEKKKRFGIALLLLVGWGILTWPYARDYSLQATLTESREGSSFQLYWWKQGQEDEQIQGVQAVYDKDRALLPLKTGILGWQKNWRLDIIDGSQEVTVRYVDLYQGEKIIRRISGQELEGYLTDIAGVKSVYSTEEGLFILPDGDDPMLYLGSRLSHSLTKQLLRPYLIQLALVAGFTFLLLVSDAIPAVKQGYILLGKSLWKKKKRLGIALLLTIVWGIVTLPRAEDYSLQIQLAQSREGSLAQIYWWNQGETILPEQAIQAPYYGRQVLLPLKEGMLGGDKEWRLDIIDSNQATCIDSIHMYRGHKQLRTISAQELEGYLTSHEGVQEVGRTEEGLWVKPSGDDPILYLGSRLSDSLTNQIFASYLAGLAGVWGISSLLLIGDMLPGLQQIYAFFGEILCKRKKRLGVVLLLTLAWGVLTWPRSQDYGLQIELSENREGDYTQLYWWKEGEASVHDQVVQVPIHGSRIFIPFQKGILGWKQEWRLDIVNSQQEAQIIGFDLYQGHEKIRSFTTDEWEDWVLRAEGIETAYGTDEGYYLVPLEEDSFLYFGTCLTRNILEPILTEYVVQLSVAGLVFLLLLMGDSLPGIRWIYDWIRKNRGRIAVMGVLFCICAAALSPQFTDYSLKIELSEEYTGHIAEIYWWGPEESISLEQSYQARIEGKQIVFPVREGMLDWNNSWRIDFIAADQKVEITSFALYQGQEWARAFSADELESYRTGSDGVEDVGSTGEVFYVNPSGDDPITYFDVRLSRTIIQDIMNDYIGKLLVVLFPIFLIVMADRLPLLRGVYQKLREKVADEKTAWLCYSGLLGAVILVVFHDFLLGDKVFLYMGDSFYQTYAQLTHLADRIAAGEWGWNYTFYESLGNAEEPIILTLKTFCTVFGRENLAYTMGYAQMIKIFLAGLFFYGFLRRMGTDKLGSTLLGLGYSCNAYIVARGMWQNYPNEAVCFALWLWGFEHFKKTKKWLPFLLVNIFCYWNYHGYTAILYTGVGLVFGIFRLVSDAKPAEEGDQSESLIKRSLKLTGIVLLGAVVSMAAWMPSLIQQLSSSRVTDGAEVASQWKNILNYTRLAGYRVMFYRALVPDALGIFEDNYVGVTNWLEDPVFYCGLMTIVAAPLGLCAMKKKKRLWYMLPLAGAIIYNMFGIVRNVANGFAGIGWKLSSLWVIILLLIFAAGLWQEKEAIEANKAGKVLLIVNVVLVVLSIYFFKDGVQVFYLATALLLSLTLSLLLFLILKETNEEKKGYLKYLLVLVAAAEVAGSSYRVVNNKSGLDAQVLKEEIYYNDATQELLAQVEDETDFYRVDKQYTSTAYCDSLYQRYKGTASYIGGVGDNDYTQKLYNYLGLPVLEHVQRGTDQNTIINALCNVKYVMTKNQRLNTYGLEYRSGKDGITLYESKYTLPFGYVYDTYMTESDFLEYNYVDRRNLMMERCILGDEAGELLPEGIKEDAFYRDFSEKWKAYQAETTLEGKEIHFAPIQEGEVAILKLTTSAQEDAWAEAYYMQGNVMLGKVDVRLVKGKSSRYMEFMLAGTDRIPVSAVTSKPYEIASVELYVIPQEVYFAQLPEWIEERSQGSFQMSHFEEEQIEGTAVLSQDSIMVFTIPYDENWSAWVDGKKQRLLQANVGFMGLALSEGSHEIILKYR
ncbi:MAG: YfhO family protein [Lachnospiraceae bacterium]|nr:YfhO family protein [Lachnospiraceae bacterium]